MIENGILNMFEKKGVIVTNKDISFDEAEEFAIEVGAEEVEEEENVLIFSRALILIRYCGLERFCFTAIL